MGNNIDSVFISVGESYVQLCTNPCAPFMPPFNKQGCSISTGCPINLCAETLNLEYIVLAENTPSNLQLWPKTHPFYPLPVGEGGF